MTEFCGGRQPSSRADHLRKFAINHCLLSVHLEAQERSWSSGRDRTQQKSVRNGGTVSSGLSSDMLSFIVAAEDFHLHSRLGMDIDAQRLVRSA